ncbi:hypothetical protein AB2M62_15205 [Sphingomonas sp. MMS12-HWE2-04]|uniref:hypothetical protein n=1 Tax=Sphingomonas sp. MMS12-HWE2-04 TaxID=3234199 RepID=UPI00384BA9BB
MANIGTILSGAFGIFTNRLGSVAVWAATYFVASLVIGFAMIFLMTGTLGLTPDPTLAPPAFGGGSLLAMLVAYVAILLLGMVIMNAVFRAVLTPEERSLASMRLGWDEFRALGLMILYLIGSVVLTLVGELVVMLIAAALGFAIGSPIAMGLVGLLLFVALIGFLVWVHVRLSPLFPLTLYRHRISIDEAWSLSRGRFWTLFTAYLAVLVPLFVVGALLGWWYMGSYLGEVAAAQNDPALIQTAAQNFAAQQAAMGLPTRILLTLVSSLLGIVGGTLWLGVAASATRALLEERGDVTEADVYRSAAIFE